MLFYVWVYIGDVMKVIKKYYIIVFELIIMLMIFKFLNNFVRNRDNNELFEGDVNLELIDCGSVFIRIYRII